MPDLSNITPVTRLEEFIDRISRGGGGALPEVSSADEGKVLTVVDNDGTYEWGAAAPASCLPEVTSSNNGQVLTVVSGEWAAAAAPASGGVLEVGYTVDLTDPDNPVFTLDKTYNEILSAGYSYLKDSDGTLTSNAGTILPLCFIGAVSPGYQVAYLDLNEGPTGFNADTVNDYPSRSNVV